MGRTCIEVSEDVDDDVYRVRSEDVERDVEERCLKLAHDWARMPHTTFTSNRR